MAIPCNGRPARLDQPKSSLEKGSQFQPVIDLDQTFGPDRSVAQAFGKADKGRLYA